MLRTTVIRWSSPPSSRSHLQTLPRRPTGWRATTTLSVVTAAALATACTKSDGAAGDKSAARGDKTVNSTKVTLPAAGTAPPPVSVDADFASVWTAPIATLSGKPSQLAEYKGKALLLVNVASKCGQTPQYATLEALQKKYASKGFTVIGFPCNQFKGQEPGTAEEIQQFCSATYGVTFPMMAKTDVNGPDRHPVYAELTRYPTGDDNGDDVLWNFEKFLVSPTGEVVGRFRPPVEPDDPALRAAIEAVLPG